MAEPSFHHVLEVLLRVLQFDWVEPPVFGAYRLACGLYAVCDVVSGRDGGDSSAGNVTEVSQHLIPDHRDSTQFVLLRGRHLEAWRLGALGRIGRATGPGGERVGCDPRARVVAATCG